MLKFLREYLVLDYNKKEEINSKDGLNTISLSTILQDELELHGLIKILTKVTTYFLSYSPAHVYLYLLTSSSHRRLMTSQSASHQGESNSTNILLLVPKPSLWTDCSLCGGRGGLNKTEWCFFRYPKWKDKKNNVMIRTELSKLLLLKNQSKLACFFSGLAVKVTLFQQSLSSLFNQLVVIQFGNFVATVCWKVYIWRINRHILVGYPVLLLWLTKIITKSIFIHQTCLYIDSPPIGKCFIKKCKPLYVI